MSDKKSILVNLSLTRNIVDAIDELSQALPIDFINNSCPQKTVKYLKQWGKDGIIIVDSTTIDKLADKIVQYDEKPKVILVYQTSFENIIAILSKFKFIQHVIGIQADHLPCQMLMKNTLAKLCYKNVFGIDKYLSPNFTFHQNYILDSINRYDETKKIESKLRRLSRSRALGRFIFDALDELLMNALYDAHPIYCDQDRTEGVLLTEDEKLSLQWGYDQQFFAVSITDPHGSLNWYTVVKYLYKCYIHRNSMIDYTTAGAGVGLYKISKSLNSLIFNVSPGKQTEAVGIIDYTLKTRDFKYYNRNFHFFDQL